MELEALKELNLKKNDVIEYMFRDPKKSRDIKLGYFEEIVKELPKMWKEGRPETPFITIHHSKDKNACFRDSKDIPLKDIIKLHYVGKSNYE